MDIPNWVIGVFSLLIAVLSYFAGSKRSSNSDVEKRARFEGEIKAKLDQLLLSVEKLEQKLTRNTTELHDEIKRQMAEHERRYHNGDNPRGN